MRILLDTHVVLWQLAGTRRLSPAASEVIGTAEALFVSVVPFAEIGIKAATGKLMVPTDLREHVHALGVRVLPLDAAHGLGVADLPLLHRDPFDRLLVAQARSERLTLVTADERLARYDVPVVAA